MQDRIDNSRPTIRQIMRRYYTIQWVYAFANGCLAGVYPLFLRSRGLNQFEINSVLATFFAVLFLTDVPTGAFADAIGRRKSFLLGCAFRVSAFLTYFFAHRYFVFLIAECIDGIGTTFCNGAIDAWGVDALDEAGFEGLKDRLFSRASQFVNFGFMAAAMIGAHLANVNIAWPWLLGAAAYCVSAAVGGFLMRGEKPRSAELKIPALARQIGTQIGGGLRQGFSSRPVLMLSAAGAIQLAAWAPYWLEWPAFFNDSFGVGIWIIGWIFCTLSVARMIGAEAVMRIGVDESSRSGVLSGLLLVAASMLFVAGLAGHRPIFVLCLLFAMNLCSGAMEPLARTWFNEQIGSDERATLLSFNSTFGTFGGSVGLLCNGRIADAFGTSAAWQFAGVLGSLAAPCYWALRPRRETVEAVVASTAD
jgi:MFS family permease